MPNNEQRHWIEIWGPVAIGVAMILTMIGLSLGCFNERFSMITIELPRKEASTQSAEERPFLELVEEGLSE